MEINEIRLKDVLPAVFAGAENDAPVNRSQIWLRDVTFRRGEVYLVEAESGTGKSSMCSYIYGNRDDYRGTISFDGRDIRSLSIGQWCEIRRTSLAILPQEMRLFPELTAMENVQIKNRLTRHLTEQQILQMFDRLEIGAKADSLVSKLSIGQQQRVAIVRTMAQPFSFLLLDEPVSHLDQRNNRIVAELITERTRTAGAAIITTSVGNPLLVEGDINHISL